MAFNENTNRNKARIGTIVFHALLLLWFAFYGLTYQDPPPEEGIAINFGYQDDGEGNTSQADPTTPPPPAPAEGACRRSRPRSPPTRSPRIPIRACRTANEK